LQKTQKQEKLIGEKMFKTLGQFTIERLQKGAPEGNQNAAKDGKGSDPKSFSSKEEQKVWDEAHQEALSEGYNAERAVEYANQKADNFAPEKKEMKEFKGTSDAVEYGKSIEGNKEKIAELKEQYQQKAKELKARWYDPKSTEKEKDQAFFDAQKNQFVREAYETAEKKVMGKWLKGAPEGNQNAAKDKAAPAKRKLSEGEAFKYYVKIKQGDFKDSKGVEAKRLNAKVGQYEGISKAYRERAGKLPKGPKQDKLLRDAKTLQDKAVEAASMRDSLLGHYAHKIFKQELSEQDIMDMFDNGEFNEALRQEILQELEQENGGL